MKVRNLVVFDMDGVIINVSESYRDTVRQTARLFFKGARSWQELPNPLFPLSDLAKVKQTGGLNNDWDLTCRVIHFLFSLVEGYTASDNPDPWVRHRTTITQCDVATLSKYLTSTTNPLTALLKEHGKPEHEFVTNLFTGDVGSGNVIKQIFQEIYLGKDLFESTYGLPVNAYDGQGLINKEKLLIDHCILEHLAGNNIMAIATGRPGAEADYPLDAFGIRKYFSVVYTLDDCIEEEKKILKQQKKKVSLSKPHPYMLDKISEDIKDQLSELFYIGDMPDDMVAASRSADGFKGIGILVSAPDKNSLKEELLRAGADYIVEDFEGLMKILKTDL